MAWVNCRPTWPAFEAALRVTYETDVHKLARQVCECSRARCLCIGIRCSHAAISAAPRSLKRTSASTGT